jgi:Protein of unknown function (DUF3082)
MSPSLQNLSFLLCVYLSAHFALKLNVRTSTNQVRLCRITRLDFAPVEMDDDDMPGLVMAEDINGPRVSVKSLDEIESEKRRAERTSTTRSSSYTSYKGPSSYSSPENSVRDKVVKTTATFGTLSVEDLKSRMIPQEPEQKDAFANRKKEDLNGIQPLTPLLFSTFPAVCSYGLWQLSAYFTNHFAVQYLDSDLYPVQRLATIGRNLVVGMTTLASGFTGVVALGLFLLGVTVSVGVMKGELDPNKPRDVPEPKKDSL